MNTRADGKCRPSSGGAWPWAKENRSRERKRERERELWGACFVLLLEDTNCLEMKLTGFGGCEDELGEKI